MRDAVEMWRHTRMVVLTALCAALYAALLIPFKAIVLIPGLTEVRPAAALPVVLALLFGPAAAWGAAFGNLIGDFFGTLTPGSFFGFIGNFLLAYVPWRLWMTLNKREATGALRQVPLFVLVSVIAACACAVVIAWGVDLLGMAPYHVLGVIISLNNTLPTVVIGAALLPLLYHRSRRWGLLAGQSMSDADLAPGPFAPLGTPLVVFGSLAGVGIAVIVFRLGPEAMPPAWLMSFGSVRNAAGVCVALIVIGSALLARPPRLRRRGAEHRVGQASRLPGQAGRLSYAGDGALALDRVSFRYPSWETLALRDVSLVVRPGEWLTLVGPTGAGKSTLCLCASGVIPQLQDGQFSGRARVFDLDTRQDPVHEISLRLGTLFQHFESQLFCTDVRSEIAFALEQRGLPRDEMQRRVDEAIRVMELGDLQRSDPATLSGGEKQRLALAALLAADPDVLVLDEPTTDVDPQGRRELMATLATLRERGKAIVIVENDLWPPQADEKIVALAEGQVRFHGPAVELLRDPDRCRELGLRPLALPDLFARLGRPERPLTVEEAVAVWRSDAEFVTLSAAERSEGPPCASEVLRRPDGLLRMTGEPIIAIEGLRHAYDQHEALTGVDLAIRRGEFVAVLGSNGAGKTTLARHLNGLLKPAAGRVLIAGQDTTRTSTAQLARTVGYLFQDPDDEIFCRRVDEEVAFGLRNLGLGTRRARVSLAPASASETLALREDEIQKRTAEALEWMGLTHAADADPFTLTRGERQQVALASVLAMRPEVIVFDEPTTGLDGVEQVRMMERLRQLNAQGHTIIMITHATWAAAAYAHRVVLMAHGAVIADGPARDIFGDDELLRQADQVAPDIVAFSRQACGQVFLSVEEAVAGLRGDHAL